MIIINFAYTSVNVFDFTIRIPFISEETIYVPQGFRNALDNIQNKMMSYGNPVVFFFIIFYLIFYFIYIAIKTLVPDTGIQTFFIPLKELLLQIPPLPTLERYGIFRLIECIFKSFGISPALEGFIKFNLCFIDFSRDNIRTILKMIFQDIEFDIEKSSDDKKSNNVEKKGNIIHKQIEEEVKICYKNNRKPMKIGMNEVERARIEYDNNQAYIKCKANSIGKYIRII
jgi:hypothetical protein